MQVEIDGNVNFPQARDRTGKEASAVRRAIISLTCCLVFDYGVAGNFVLSRCWMNASRKSGSRRRREGRSKETRGTPISPVLVATSATRFVPVPANPVKVPLSTTPFLRRNSTDWFWV